MFLGEEENILYLQKKNSMVFFLKEYLENKKEFLKLNN